MAGDKIKSMLLIYPVKEGRAFNRGYLSQLRPAVVICPMGQITLYTG
jgi:hypothetical protein